MYRPNCNRAWLYLEFLGRNFFQFPILIKIWSCYREGYTYIYEHHCVNVCVCACVCERERERERDRERETETERVHVKQLHGDRTHNLCKLCCRSLVLGFLPSVLNLRQPLLNTAGRILCFLLVKKSVHSVEFFSNHEDNQYFFYTSKLSQIVWYGTKEMTRFYEEIKSILVTFHNMYFCTVCYTKL